jgi:ribokinase
VLREAEKTNMPPLSLDARQLRYSAMAGVGGIGSGMFFALNHSHTLGREESRSGRLLDRRDYCKLHIISHYVKALLGPAFAVYPIGRVGADEPGRWVMQEMLEAGLDLSHVRIGPGEQTLFSFCFQYPDGSGGNLTTDDSASGHVTTEAVAQAERIFETFRGRGIVLAAPEVPLDTREALLEAGAAHQFMRVASFVTSEIAPARERGLMDRIDLLALNLDEAAAVTGEAPKREAPQAVVEKAVEYLRRLSPGLGVSITAGRHGSWAWDGRTLHHQPALETTVVSTAGAGDAHLAGLIAAAAAGLPLGEALQLGSLMAGLSVQSPHTIHKQIDRDALHEFARHQTVPWSAAILELLDDKSGLPGDTRGQAVAGKGLSNGQRHAPAESDMPAGAHSS